MSEKKNFQPNPEILKPTKRNKRN